jgi:acyl-CoA thioesterase I
MEARLDLIIGRRGWSVPALASIVLAAQSATAAASSAAAPVPRAAAEACLAANATPSIGASLPRTRARLAAGQVLTVVALGSSSTTGTGSGNPAFAFPEVMRREFLRLWPSARLAVVNSGRYGETVPANLARLETDVLRHHPDLVVWQLGTNDVLWGSVAGRRAQIAHGVRRLKASGADVVLMDLQYAPRLLNAPHHRAMQALIADIARSERVGLFRRFALTRRAINWGVPWRALVASDALHNSAEGYDCVGRALARAINAAAR